MGKKQKISLNRSDQLESIDAELGAALERLDDVNERIDDLLTTLAPADSAEEKPAVEPDPEPGKDASNQDA